MFTIKIWIITLQINGSDLEEMNITSEKSLRSAKNQATRWIKKNYFESDIESLTKKEQITAAVLPDKKIQSKRDKANSTSMTIIPFFLNML